MMPLGEFLSIAYSDYGWVAIIIYFWWEARYGRGKLIDRLMDRLERVVFVQREMAYELEEIDEKAVDEVLPEDEWTRGDLGSNDE